MRTSLTETQRIEELLLTTGKPADRLLLQSEALINPSLAEKIGHQRQVVHAVQAYGREQLRSEIQAVDSRLFDRTRPNLFQRVIHRIFQKQ